MKMTRTLRHGGYASLMIIGVIAIVIAVNLVVDQVPWKADLTQNRIFSLSEDTAKILSGLKTDVTVTTIGKPGQENPTILEILKKYALRSRRLILQTVDPDKNPGWAKQYDTSGSGLREGALVVSAGKRFKSIAQFDLYALDYSNPNQQPQVTGLTVEQRVTSAIQYVTADRNPTIAVLQGQGESTLGALGLTDAVGNDNYEVKELNLLTVGAVPPETDVLAVIAPKNDLSTADAEKIRAYLSGGGRGAFFLDLPQQGATLPNLDDLLKTYGIAMRRVLVVEGDQNSIAFGNPLFLLPKQQTHAILAPLQKDGLPLLLPASQAVDTLPLKKRSLKIEPLLTTTANSWAKPNYAKLTSAARERGDGEGPFTLAVAITDPAETAGGRDAKLVVVGSSGMLVREVAARAPGNRDFFLNTLGWLKDRKDTITIRPKSVAAYPLRISGLQSLLLSGIVVVIIPLIVLGWGFAVWMRRRHL